jgi:hypothetical protein
MRAYVFRCSSNNGHRSEPSTWAMMLVGFSSKNKTPLNAA